MENFSYHVPFFVATNGIATSGHSSDLVGGQIGLFDRQNFSVATAAGLAKELFFAQGAIGGKDWYGKPVTDSHKSPFFLAKDVTNIYKSLPAKIQNEEWVVGYDGSASSKSIEFIAGKPTRIKMYFHGEPVYRMFNAPKEYVVSYTPAVACTDDCASGCDSGRKDPKPHAIKLVDIINKHVELQKLGVQAKLVEDTFSAAAVTKEQYKLEIFDEGTGVSLAQVKAQYAGKDISSPVNSRKGVVSTYILTQPVADSAPVDFQYDGSTISLAICNECPSGWTLIAGKDVYIINRPLAGTEDLSSDGQPYADLVKADYAIASSVATFLGQNGSVAVIKLKVPTGTAVTALLADSVSFEYAQGATCVSTAGGVQAWVDAGTGVSGKRTLKIKLKRPDCDTAGNRLADVTSALSGITGINIGDLTKIAGDGCFDEYTVTQNSDDYLNESCLTGNVSFTYGTPLPLIDGHAWEILDPTISVNDARKVGIKISAGYYDPKFGNCSFDPTDYYENMPIKMELSALIEDADNCKFAAAPSQVQTKIAKIARQSGEFVVREVIMKTDAYLKHVDQWDSNPRMREAFDMQLLNSVDRNASYVLWYISYGANYNQTSRKGHKEQFTTVVAFKENDPALAQFEAKIVDIISAKSEVIPHVNG